MRASSSRPEKVAARCASRCASTPWRRHLGGQPQPDAAPHRPHPTPPHPTLGSGGVGWGGVARTPKVPLLDFRHRNSFKGFLLGHTVLFRLLALFRILVRTLPLPFPKVPKVGSGHPKPTPPPPLGVGGWGGRFGVGWGSIFGPLERSENQPFFHGRKLTTILGLFSTPFRGSSRP